MKLSVWAPLAKSVELVTPQRRLAMRPGEEGNWLAEYEDTMLRDGYRYSIDGREPVPDPRSRWQPDGVHGASRVVNETDLTPAEGSTRTPVDSQGAHRLPADAQCSDRLPADSQTVFTFHAKRLRDAVIYELHIGTFTPQGTYAAAQAKLPHLVQLGITHIELMPLASFPGQRGWGYDGVDLYAPFAPYGTPGQLVSFIQSCHAQGVAVLLDVVYNHLGPDGNYLAQFGPYFTDRYKTGWGAAMNYDGPHSGPVRRFIIDNALMWLRDYGFDGLRLDAVHAIFSFDAVPVLEELATAVRELGEQLGRRFVLIAESDMNDPRLVHAPSKGGFGLDAHWADDFHHAVHRYFTDEADGYYADFKGLSDVAAALRDGYVYQGQYSTFRGRRHGRPPKGVSAHQLVVSAQNHDQIGNRAQGERLSMLLNAQQLKAVAAMTLLSPFVPLLFQGEEWGARTPFLYFTDHENTELGRLVAEGRSREFSSFRWQGAVPNPQDLGTFERSKLDWSELETAPHAELYEWHRQLIRLRRDKVDDGGKAVVKFDAKAQWFRFAHGGLLALFNLAPRPQRVPMPAGEWELVLRSELGAADDLGGSMAAQATDVYRKRQPS